MIQPAATLAEAVVSRPGPRSVEIRRIFTVAPEVLWELFTSAAHFGRWWGPRDKRCTDCALDVRVGGAWFADLRGEDGRDHRMSGVYRLVEPNSRLQFTWSWRQEDGTQSPESLVTLEFSKRRLGSELRILHAELPEPVLDGHQKGWLGSLDRLAAYLEAEGPKGAGA